VGDRCIHGQWTISYDVHGGWNQESLLVVPHPTAPLFEALSSDLADLSRRQSEALEAFDGLALPDHAANARAELAQIADQIAAHADRLRGLLPPADGVVRPTNLHRAIRDAVASRRDLLAAHDVQYAFEGVPLFVAVHRGHLDLVLAHLLTIAADAMRDTRGKILIGLHAKQSGRVSVEISDTGRGTTADRALDLAIARAAARAYGGDLTALHTQGVGSTFIFDLPRAAHE
jgi:signal transduction histidine kinase